MGSTLFLLIHSRHSNFYPMTWCKDGCW